MLLIDYFERTAEQFPDRLFTHFVGETANDDIVYTYRDANLAASRYARLLRNMNVSKGDPIGFLLPNSMQWLICYLACQKIGAVAAGVNTELLPDELNYPVDLIRTEVILTTAVLHAAAEALKKSCPRIARIIVDGDGGDICLDDSDEIYVRDADICDTDTLSIAFTSGTTGAVPKAVLQCSRNIVNGIAGYQERLQIRPDDRVMLVTPLFHGSALNWGVTMALLGGGSIVLARKFSASRFWSQADRGGTTVLWTMGSIIFILLTQAVTEIEKRAAARLRILFGAAIAARFDEVLKRWPCEVMDGFGMTETPGTLTQADCFNLSDPYPCIGRAVTGVDLKIIDPETGADLPVRGIGELVVRYGQGFVGYLHNAAAMAEAVKDGWFHTGDIAYLDETGRVFFVDRLKSIIRRGGENISSMEVENCLIAHPDILEAIALPKSDPVLGETVAAVLVPTTPGRAFSVAEIHQFCDGRLARFKWPELVLTVAQESIPKTGTGRVKKKILREELKL